MCTSFNDEPANKPPKWRKAFDQVYEMSIQVGLSRAILFTYENQDEKGHPRFGVGIGAPFTEREYLNVQYMPNNSVRPLVINKDARKIGFVLDHEKDLASDELPSSLREGVTGLLRVLKNEASLTERVN